MCGDKGDFWRVRERGKEVVEDGGGGGFSEWESGGNGDNKGNFG